MASRDIKDCHPDLQALIPAFKAKCKEKGFDVLIYCTYRSNAEQDMLYAIGRTTVGDKVTNAKAGQSAHNFTIDGKPASKAFDAVPCLAGKPLWNNYTLINLMGQAGEDVGLEWAGNWISFKEKVHFQLKGSK